MPIHGKCLCGKYSFRFPAMEFVPVRQKALKQTTRTEFMGITRPTHDGLKNPGSVQYTVEVAEDDALEGVACHCANCKTCSRWVIKVTCFLALRAERERARSGFPLHHDSGASFNVQVGTTGSCAFNLRRGGRVVHDLTWLPTFLHACIYIQAPTDRIELTHGSPKVYGDGATRSGKIVQRYFCGDCGSALWSTPGSMDNVSFLKVGPLSIANKVRLSDELFAENANPGWSR